MRYGYSIVFIPHPQVRIYLEDFNLPSFIFTSYKESMQKLFCESSIMITDYSSVAFEMAVLNKPVLYYQFDKDEFFAKHSYTQGYFDYEKDGFGLVVENGEKLLREFEIILQNNCKLFGTYKNNVNSAFIFRNGSYCKKIYKILNKY